MEDLLRLILQHAGLGGWLYLTDIGSDVADKIKGNAELSCACDVVVICDKNHENYQVLAARNSKNSLFVYTSNVTPCAKLTAKSKNLNEFICWTTIITASEKK